MGNYSAFPLWLTVTLTPRQCSKGLLQGLRGWLDTPIKMAQRNTDPVSPLALLTSSNRTSAWGKVRKSAMIFLSLHKRHSKLMPGAHFGARTEFFKWKQIMSLKWTFWNQLYLLDFPIFCGACPHKPCCRDALVFWVVLVCFYGFAREFWGIAKVLVDRPITGNFSQK